MDMGAQERPREPVGDLIRRRAPGIVTFGMTPPKTSTPTTRIEELAEKHVARIAALDIDAVIMYDIHDEADRASDVPRPFPFSETLDGAYYAAQYLVPRGLVTPVVHFRCVAKYNDPVAFHRFLATAEHATVVVGGAASSQSLPFTLHDAFDACRTLRPDLVVGAVAIAERHAAKGDEHRRMLQKQRDEGCTFFVTQCCYNSEEAKNMLSDYSHLCRSEGVPMVPILITLTPCGSAQTYDFLRWLGVRVSPWLANDLRHPTREGGILAESMQALIDMFRDIVHFANSRGIPIGANVESVAIRKAEIDAAVQLVGIVRRILNEPVRDEWNFAAAATN